MAHKFSMLKVSGSRYEIGIQVGEALRDTIPRTINGIFDYELTLRKEWTRGDLPTIPNPLTDELLHKTRDFLPLCVRSAHC